MRRRALLALGAFSAAALLVGGGAVALLHPGLQESRLSPPARVVFASVARALLDGSLPVEGPARDTAVGALLDRIDTLVGNLPAHAQGELSQLLSILASGAGRRVLAGVADPWEEASVATVQAGLQHMRLSSVSLRQQAYQALHEIVGAAYFADPAAWRQIGYPGPVEV